jgi:hypothetical protein
MAKKFIKELGDKNSKNVASTDGVRVKTIAPAYYMTSDAYVADDANVKLIQDELDKKQDNLSWDNASGVATYNKDSNKAATVSSVDKRIEALTVSSVGGNGKYIKSISETGGKIAPVAGDIDNTVTESSSNPVTSGAVYTAIQSSTGSASMDQLDLNADETICDIKQENGVVTATKQAIQLTATFDQATRTLIFNNITFSTGIWPNRGCFGLGVWSRSNNPGSDSAEAVAFHGDREWILDWRPYLIDMSPVPGQVKKKPVAELMKNNWLRTVDGNYAPVVGITAAQSTACDKAAADTPVLYWKKESGVGVTAISDSFYDGLKFNPVTFWEYCKYHRADEIATLAGTTYNSPIEVKLYKADGTEMTFGAITNNHIVAPWETTETKYSIFIGRPDDIYVFDGVTGNSQGEIHGITSKPVTVDGQSATDFKLVRTGISPCPYTTKDGKARLFFYNYNGTDSNTKGSGQLANDGTYPRTVDVNAYSTHARACNSDTSKSYPVAEGGWFAFDAFLTSLEAGYGTKALHANTITKNGTAYTMFTSGVSSNDSASASNGGVDIGTNGTPDWKNWSDSTYGSNAVNGYYPKFKCLEPQIAASLIVEMGIANDETKTFDWNGGLWSFRTPSGLPGYGINGLNLGEMNVVLMKVISEKTVGGQSASLYLRAGLAQGVNLCGDLWAYYAGGCELIYTATSTATTGNKADFYVCPDQTKWVNLSSTVKNPTGGKFPAETAEGYIHTVNSVNQPNESYVAERYPNSPYIKTVGGSLTTAECFYTYTQLGEGAPAVNDKTRRRLCFRGSATSAGCSPRSLDAHVQASDVYAHLGGSAQCLLA